MSSYTMNDKQFKKFLQWKSDIQNAGQGLSDLSCELIPPDELRNSQDDIERNDSAELKCPGCGNRMQPQLVCNNCGDYKSLNSLPCGENNKQMDEIQTDNIVKKILLIQSTLVGYTHIDEIKQAFDDIEIVVSDLHH